MNRPHLKKTSATNKLCYYMYGKHAVFAAIDNPKRKINKIYCLEKTYAEYKNKLAHLPIEIVSADFLKNKIGQNQVHQGIVAHVQTIFSYNIDNLDLDSDLSRIVIIDQITDPQNIGAIIRSSAAFGATKLILTKNHSPEENATIAKAASGCLELVQIAMVTNLKTAIDTLKRKNFWIAGLDAGGTDNIKNLTQLPKLAVIIGSEGKGMRHLTEASCDFLVRIPISNQVESLNAASAAAIILHALSNQSFG